MGRTVKSIALRFGLPLLAFAAILLLTTAVQRLLGFSFDVTILFIALMIATAWHAGRAPGIVVALAFEAALLGFASRPPSAATILFTVNRLALFLSLVLFTSARRAAERRLSEQRELLEVTLKSIGDAVIATDLDGRVTFVNPVAENLTGWSAAEAAGRPLTEIFNILAEDTRRPVESPFAEVVARGAIVGLANHTLLVARDGAEVPIEDSGAPIRDARGATVGAIIVFHDVTERRRAERERERLLASEKAARLEAELAGRLKDEFLATVSHELRTPLSAILGWTVMLKNRQLEEQHAGRALEIIERNARLQGEIINDLLDVSQITTGRLTIEKEPVELVPLVRTTVESLRPQALAKSIALECELDETTPAIVVGDSVRLRQIVWNIVSNALKFTPEGGRIDVRTENLDGRVELTVRDTGIGISKKFLPFVFDKFRQSDASITRPHGGLGLGLSIVRHLVRLHGGRIAAASEGAGRGAVFTVQLPLAGRRIN